MTGERYIEEEYIPAYRNEPFGVYWFNSYFRHHLLRLASSDGRALDF